MRTTLADRLRSPALAIPSAVLSVLAVLAMTFLVHGVLAHHIGQYADIKGRRRNLEHLRETGNIYLPFGVEAFTYPPAAIFLFWPLVWVPALKITLFWTFVALSALVGAFFIVLNYLFALSRLTTFNLACWGAVVCTVAFPVVDQCFTWGQTGSFLLLLVVLDLLAVRGRARGVFVGLAAAFKIYPGLFIVAWLLRRQWREAATALTSAAGSTALALVLWPSSVRTFFTTILFGGDDLDRFNHGPSVYGSSSFAALFLRPPFHVGFLGHVGTLAACAGIMGFGLYCGHRLWRRELPYSSMMVVLIASTIGSPVAWDHYFVFAPLLALMPVELGWRNPLARAALVATALTMIPWYYWRNPPRGDWWVSLYTCLTRNAILSAMLIVLVGSLFERRAVVAPPVELAVPARR
jgi:alpha-1,2-mannosyltransferase